MKRSPSEEPRIELLAEHPGWIAVDKPDGLATIRERDTMQQERVSPQGALRDYGVVATRAGLDWVVDADATARERAARAAAAAAT